MFTKFRSNCIALSLCAAFSSTACASTPSSLIVKIEEEWELRVGTPDPNSNAPQFSTVMCPTRSLDSWHATVELNHCTEPYVCGGGVHLQLWNGDLLVADKGWGEFKSLDRSDDIVRWTQVLELRDGRLEVSIRDGTGESWGAFGGDELKVTAEAPVYELCEYQVDTSVKESGVCLASNRVHEMVLRKVRYTMADGSVSEDVLNRIIK